MSSSKKFIAILGGFLGIFIVILGLIVPSMGWWEVLFDPLLGNDISSYISPFGYSTNTANDNVEFLGGLLLLGGVLFLIGSFLVIVGAAKDSKLVSFLFSLVMLSGLVLFCAGLATNEDFENIISGLDFLYGGDHNVFFGNASGILLLGEWTWRLGNGFFLGIVAAIIALIGSLLIE